MVISDYLASQIRAGNVILFLGAGASIGAKSPVPPLDVPVGWGLAKLLADKFLGGIAADKNLYTVAEYCITTTDLRTVQE